MAERIAQEPRRFGAAADVKRILRLMAKREKKLEEKALAKASEVYG